MRRRLAIIVAIGAAVAIVFARFAAGAIAGARQRVR